jgi:hypothetical protein
MAKEIEWFFYSTFVIGLLSFLWWYWFKTDYSGVSGKGTKRPPKPSPSPTPGPSPGPAPPKPGPEPPIPVPSCTNILNPPVFGSLDQGGTCTAVSNVLGNQCKNGSLFFIDSEGRASCTGSLAPIETIRVTTFCTVTEALVSYFSRIYPLTQWASASDAFLLNMYKNLEFHYPTTGVNAEKPGIFKDGPANVNIAKKKLSRYSSVEVFPVEPAAPSLNKIDQFLGTMYWTVTGSGWFADVGTCLYAYNVCHALSLLGASAEKILAVSGPRIRNQIQIMQAGSNVNTTPSCVQPLKSEIGNAACVFTPRYSGLVSTPIDSFTLYKTIASCWTYDSKVGSGVEKPARQLLVELASLRGYDSVQILNEPESSCPAFILFCSESVYHYTTLKRLCPLGQKELNKNNSKLVYLNAYVPAHVTRVDEIHFDGQNTAVQDAADWSFKTKCKNDGGVLNVVDVLTTCRQIVSFGSPFLVFSLEIQSIDWTKLPSANELERLQSYFSVVYGSTDVWKTKSLFELQQLWQTLEFRWQLPIQPTTPAPNTRRQNTKFYQSQTLKGTLDQDPDRLGEELEYVEVVRFGTAVSRYDNEQLFAGTYYYPVRGSGLFLPVGRVLFSYNKIHAFRLLGCTDEEIVFSLRPNLIAFLQNESSVVWTNIQEKNPGAIKSNFFKNYCNWNTSSSSSQCLSLFEFGMTEVYLCSAVVAKFIDDFCTGSSSRKYSDSAAPLSFFEYDPFLDRMIAQVAAQRGFDTCIFLKIVGFDIAQELVHCKDPVTSLMMLKKFTPFDPQFSLINATRQDTVNFYIPQSVPRVGKQCLTELPYKPFTQSTCTFPKVLVRYLGQDVKF